MITAEYVQEQLKAVQSGEPTPAKVRDYALLCIAQKYLGKDTPTVTAYPLPVMDAPTAKPCGETTISQDLGDSDFFRAVSGKETAAVLSVMDKHMNALRQMNERAYNLIMKRIQEI